MSTKKGNQKMTDKSYFAENFREPGKEYRPEVRWWLAEALHTDETLKREIELIDNAGFGAVEFLAMPEPGLDDTRYGWGSEEWIHDTHVLTGEATGKGLGVSYTSGTHWATANLTTICPDDRAASKELGYTVEKICAGTRRQGELKKAEIKAENVERQDLAAVVAIKALGERDGSVMVADKGVVLTSRVKDGKLDWQAPSDGDYLLFTFWIHGTGQTAEPSASTSYTINYLDMDGIQAFTDYWSGDVLTEQLREHIRHNGRVQMYMDSLELTMNGSAGQLWGYCFLEEFLERRGYDLTPYLPLVPRDFAYPLYIRYHYVPESITFHEKLQHDLYQTMTELYMEHMLKPMQEWLHSVSMTLRAEISYGLPFEISLPGKYVDGIETESLEFCAQLESYRGMAGASHIYQRLFSSETGATMRNFRMPMDFYQQIIFTQFAAGVSRTVLHGWSSICGSVSETKWPGHEGMYPVFSERFGERQPAFAHYGDWNKAITRFQWLLRQGSAAMDLGILRTDYHFDNTINAMEYGQGELWRYEHSLLRSNEGIYWRDMTLQNNGYTYEYFAPQILDEDFTSFEDGRLFPKSPGYRALLIYQEGIPLSAARKLLQLCQKGLPVIFVDNYTEMISVNQFKTHARAASDTWYLGDSKEELAKVVAQIKECANVRTIQKAADTMRTLKELDIEPSVLFEVPNKNILTAVREDGSRKIIYFYNYLYKGTPDGTDMEPFTFKAGIQGKGTPSVMDCWSGQQTELGFYEIKDGRTWVELTLKPGEATVYLLELGKDAYHAVSKDNCEIVRENGQLAVYARESGTYRLRLSDGSTKIVDIEAPLDIPLDNWTLNVESWEAGKKREIHEDRGLGYESVEVYYETLKREIAVGRTDLIPWKDISAVGPDVSGLGRYRTEFKLPDSWNSDNKAVLEITSTCDSTAMVYLNGVHAGGYDFDRKTLNISKLVQPGQNKLEIEVSTTLNNRLLANGYFNQLEFMPDGRKSPYADVTPENYGLAGKVQITTYGKAIVACGEQ